MIMLINIRNWPETNNVNFCITVVIRLVDLSSCGKHKNCKFLQDYIWHLMYPNTTIPILLCLGTKFPMEGVYRPINDEDLIRGVVKHLFARTCMYWRPPSGRG